MHIAAVPNELKEPLAELGRRWAESRFRPRPTEATLCAWDNALEEWIQRSDLPLVTRNLKHRGECIVCGHGRSVLYGDNTPANWAFSLALTESTPPIRSWNKETLQADLPLSILSKWAGSASNLNKTGWKVCHIDPVSDKKHGKIEDASSDRVKSAFRRLMSPRNMFLIPKAISGAGELMEVIGAIEEFNKLHG